jgi:chorismate mutase
MADKHTFIDRITNRTTAVAGLLAAVVGLLTAFFDAFNKFGDKWAALKTLPWWSRWSLAGLLLLLAIYLIKAAFAGKSRLLRPDRFLIRSDEPRFLKGREREVEELGHLATRERLIFLDGESGSGKSALVRAGLLPWCETRAARPLPLLIDLSGAVWDAGLTDLFGRDLWIQREKLCKELGLSEYPRAEQLFDVLKKIKAHTARIPLLIFDQFDDYQTAYRKEFYPETGSRLLKSEEFLAKNHFWSQIAQGVSAGDFHCIAITRNDTRAGLDAIRFCDARSYSLLRVENALIEPLLDEITAPGQDGSPVVDEPESGWNQLRERLLIDLASQDGRILPIQLTVALDAIRRWRFLTVAQYRTQGGLPGLERLHIQGHVQDAAHLSGMQIDSLIKVLLLLTDSEGKKTRRRSFDALGKAVSKTPSEHLRRALERLEEGHVLRQVANLEGDGGESWLLYHDYLARGVIEAHRMSDRWRLFLADQALAWQRADSWREKWKLLLPVTTQGRLAWETVRGRLHLAPHYRYLAWSTLRATPALVAITIAIGGYEWSQRKQDLDVATITIEALNDSGGLSENQARHFQRMIRSRWRAKKAALQYALENADASRRALIHVEMLTHAVVGLDKTGQRSEVLVKICLDEVISRPGKPPADLAIGTLQNLHFTNPQAMVKNLVELVKKEGNPSARRSMAEALQAVGAKLEPKTAESVFKDLMELMKKETNSDARQSMAEAIQAVGAKLEPKTARSVATNLVELMRKETNSSARRSMAEAIQAVGGKLEAKTAESVATDLVELIKKENDPYVRWSMARAIQAVGGKLEAKTAESVATDLMELIRKESDPYVRESMAWAIQAVGGKLEAKTARSVATNLVELMRKETNSSARRSMAEAIQAVGAKLEPKTAENVFKDLMDLMKKESDPFARDRMAKAIQAVGAKLEPKTAETVAKDLVELMKTESNSSVRQSMDGALQAVSTSLEPKAAESVAKELVKIAESVATDLVELIKKETNPYVRQSMGRAIQAVGAKLEPKTAESVATDLVELMKKETNSSARQSMARAIQAVGAKLEPKTAESMVKDLIALVKNNVNLNLEVLDIIEDLENKFGSKDTGASSRLQSYVDLLKGYRGGVAWSRITLLKIMEVITGQKFEGDKWRFVEWATSQDASKYRLNLD